MLYSRDAGFTAYYVRVSSTDQSFRSQTGDLEAHAKHADGKAAWYRDKVTGTTMNRPEWNRLWADVLAGRVTRIVVWRLDRLGRLALSRDGLIARDRWVAALARDRDIPLASTLGGGYGTDMAEVAERHVASILALGSAFVATKEAFA